MECNRRYVPIYSPEMQSLNYLLLLAMMLLYVEQLIQRIKQLLVILRLIALCSVKEVRNCTVGIVGAGTSTNRSKTFQRIRRNGDWE